MRKTIIAGNWKLNKNIKDAIELVTLLPDLARFAAGMLVYAQALHVEARNFAVKLAGQPDSALLAFLIPLLTSDSKGRHGASWTRD